MAAPTDRVRVLKVEDPSDGGTDDDFGFHSLANPNKDAPSVAGMFIQPPPPSTSQDELVYLTRDSSGNMIFRDSVDGTERTLTELLGEAVVDYAWRRRFLMMGG